MHLCKMKIELWLSGWFCRPSCSSDDWWQGNTDNIKAWVIWIPRIVSWYLVYLMKRTFYKSNKVFISSWTYGREFILLRDSLQKPRQIHVAYIINTCYTCINCNLVCMKEREGRERRSEKCFKIIFLIKFLKFYIFVSFCFKSLLTE